jgi:drug/metabolite transporter (DMT)-like permease
MLKRTGNLLFSPVLALSLSSLFWAGNFTVGRALRDDIDAVALNHWRWSIAALILLPFSIPALRMQMPLIFKHWKLLVSLSITGVVAFHISVYHALQTTTAINALLFLSICPVLILFGSRLVFKETLRIVQVIGVSVSLAGVIVLLTHGEPERLILLQFNPGDLWMLLAILLWSAYSVMLKTKPDELSQTVLLASIVVFGVVMMTPIYLFYGYGNPGFSMSGQVFFGLLYIGIFASVLAYYFWNYGVSKLGPNRAGSYLHLMPLFGAVLSILFLEEGIQPYHLFGAVFIASGIMMSMSHRRKHSA